MNYNQSTHSTVYICNNKINSVYIYSLLSFKSEILLAFNKRKEKKLWMAHLQAQNPNLLPSN